VIAADGLANLYRIKRDEIERRLEEFRQVWHRGDKEIFAELCFCLLTPQSKAESCDAIVRTLKEKGLLLEGGLEEIRPYLKKTRFYKTKSQFLVEARRLFQRNGTLHLKERLDPTDTHATRDWLVSHVKGVGYKEASHFLRNIGLGKDLAILDIHVLRHLKKLGLLRILPKSLTRKRYLTLEKKLRRFARRIEIPLSHLDLLLWYAESHRIFK